MYPSSGSRSGGTSERTLVPVFRSGGTSECTLVPVFIPGEHPPKPPFWKPPFYLPVHIVNRNIGFLEVESAKFTVWTSRFSLFLMHSWCAIFASKSRLRCLFQAALDTYLNSPLLCHPLSSRFALHGLCALGSKTDSPKSAKPSDKVRRRSKTSVFIETGPFFSR